MPEGIKKYSFPQIKATLKLKPEIKMYLPPPLPPENENVFMAEGRAH